MTESREKGQGPKPADRSALPYFVLVRLGPLKPYGNWFSLRREDGTVIRARKLLPESVTVLGRVTISDDSEVVFDPEVDDEEVRAEGREFARLCSQERDPFFYAIARASEPLDDQGPALRWLEVNPANGSLVVHTLLVELETGERLIVGAHQVPWEEDLK